jgi:hypothetical protein
MSSDERLLATHISLFTALFIQWQRNGFVSPFPVTRKKLMTISKIASVATYHKCIRQLNDYRYIRYQPDYHPKKGSLVYWPTEPETQEQVPKSPVRSAPVRNEQER